MNKIEKSLIGSVMVIGAGVSGMQAALDSADLGFKVYLVEKDFAIGGTMAALDKTFPTNDCAMCTISPRLVGVANHPDIEILTGATVTKCEGEPGNFIVTVRERARYVDVSKCTGCGLCSEECPVQLPREFDGNLSTRKAISRLYPQAVPAAFYIDKRGMAPCRHSCPAGISVQGYMVLTALGKYREALEVIYRDIPFPGTCGRICPHLCEDHCTRRDQDEALSIMSVKRFLADRGSEYSFPLPSSEHPQKVALIGSGPSSLTAAYHLRLLGYSVTLFERSSTLGGMLRWGVPPFRLPREVLDEEIDRILALGVVVRKNVEMGRDITIHSLLDQGFDAVFLGPGLPKSRKLHIKGDECDETVPLIEFLSSVYTNKVTYLRGPVVIIGGGNTAVDAARTAVRLGASRVTLVSLEPSDYMPAYTHELREAVAEGVIIRDSTAPLEYMAEKHHLKGLKVCHVSLQSPDDEGLPIVIPTPEGPRRAVPVEGSEELIECAYIITAIGQEMERNTLTGLSSVEMETLLRGRMVMLNHNGRTVPLLCGGDLARGPATAIEAMADGRKASSMFDCFFKGVPFNEPEKPEGPARGSIDEEASKRPRAQPPRAIREEALQDFREIEKAFTEKQALEEASRCLGCGICSECMRCQQVCEVNALIHDEKPYREREIFVGAIIASPGFELFDAGVNPEYGLGRWKNVVTSLQFERILSASGPTMGQLTRPGDGKTPTSIAFLQCIGSRDEERPYCSSVCCLHATKQALLVKEHNPDSEVEIFHIDIRAQGKGYEAFYQRARSLGVKYTQCRISSVKEKAQSGNLVFQAREADGAIERREFDMTVLSCGFVPPSDGSELAEALSISLNDKGFCATDSFAPLDTSRPGVFACGAFRGPADISEVVSEASGAASRAGLLLWGSRNTLICPRHYPPEREVTGRETRIGVFICHCGRNIGGVLDVPALAEEAGNLKDVVHVEDNLYTCARDSLEKIKKAIVACDLNRVVVASCTPRTHESLFQEALRESGLNASLFEMANIRDQCSWVHGGEPAKAQQKGKALIRAAVAKARHLAPVFKSTIPVDKKALVIGAGAAGMTAALELADRGFFTFLVEREKEPGGKMLRVRHSFDGVDTSPFLADLIRRVRQNKNIRLLTESRITGFSGFLGSFSAEVMTPSCSEKFTFGAVIMATGAEELKPDAFFYGVDKRVVTLLELEEIMHKDPQRINEIKEAAFILCVGSRCEERPHCSRICCTSSIKSAILMKNQNPDMSVYIIYRDIRTYGFREELYLKARKAGVIFLKVRDEDPPVLERESGGESDDPLHLTLYDCTLGATVKLHPHLVTLASAIIPDRETRRLFELMKVPLSPDGFFLEAHMKLRPLEFPTEGIFLCGLAHYPKSIDETLIQAHGAVAKASAILSRDSIETGIVFATVRPEKCITCLTCVRCCPYGIPRIEDTDTDGKAQAAYIEAALCHGCGICASECPVKAIELLSFTDEQIISMSSEVLSAEREEVHHGSL